LKSFVDRTFKASCDAKTQKGCNPQEKRYLEKVGDKTVDELVEEKKVKSDELKKIQSEKKQAEKEHKEVMKKFKKKEVALKKAVSLLKQLEKINKGKTTKDEL